MQQNQTSREVTSQRDRKTFSHALHSQTAVGRKTSSIQPHRHQISGTKPICPIPVPYAPLHWGHTLYSLVLLDNQSNSISIHNQSQVYPIAQSLCQAGLSEAEGAVFLYSSLEDAVTKESSTLLSLCQNDALNQSIFVGVFVGWNSSPDERPRKIGRKLQYGMVRLIDVKPVPKSLQSTLPRSVAPGLHSHPVGSSSFNFEGLTWRVFGREEAAEGFQEGRLQSSSKDEAQDLSAQAEKNDPPAKPAKLRAQEEKTNKLMQEVKELEYMLRKAKSHI